MLTGRILSHLDSDLNMSVSFGGMLELCCTARMSWLQFQWIVNGSPSRLQTSVLFLRQFVLNVVIFPSRHSCTKNSLTTLVFSSTGTVCMQADTHSCTNIQSHHMDMELTKLPLLKQTCIRYQRGPMCATRNPFFADFWGSALYLFRWETPMRTWMFIQGSGLNSNHFQKRNITYSIISESRPCPYDR